jgi:glycerol-1-phosphate dehydrogenase [NAD(P)+]
MDHIEKSNIVSLRMGRGTINRIGIELDQFVVFTMEIPWKVSRDKLGKTPERVVFVESVEEDWLEAKIEEMPACNAVVGIGGGQAVDAAKYMSWKKGIRLVTIPTILSVDAFVTTAAGVRRDHQVVYVGESTPDPLVIDYDIIRTAPKQLNIAGVGDLLSCHTASFDWELAHAKGKSEYQYSERSVKVARGIIDRLESILPAIRENEDEGLKSIVDGYMELNNICLPAGHWRIEEGSEHYLFYELEERLKRPFIHGNVIGLGIYILSRLQNNEVERITDILDRSGLEYHPAAMELSKSDLKASLLNLKSFVESKSDFWYTIINDAEINEAWVDGVLADLKF